MDSRASVTWLGHATALLELGGLRLLTDPVLRDRIGPLVRIAPAPDPVGSLDAVLLSHLHADHADLRSLRAVASATAVLAPRGAGDWLRGCGLSRVHELSRGQAHAIGELTIEATRAVHDPGRRPFGPEAEPVGFLVGGAPSVYFAGDTDLFDEMEALRGRVDVALLPVWGWGSRLGPGHLDPERAARAAAMISPALAIPIHWGTFALGRPARRPADPEWPAREFAALAGKHAPAVEVRVLAPGQRTTF